MTSLGLALIFLLVITAAENVLSELEEDASLVPIVNLEDYCTGYTCSGLRFPDVERIPIIDLKPEIRISKDGTYDMTNPLMKTNMLVFKESQMAHFPLALFLSIPLTELDMRNCSIEKLIPQNFIKSENLQILLLSDNYLEEILAGTFTSNANLQYLFLERNNIVTLYEESFQGLLNLNYLSLEDNLIEYLPRKIFRYMPNLRHLGLSGNSLRVLENDLFVNNANLQEIVVSRNALITVGSDVFKHPNNLVLVDLSGNPGLYFLNLKINTRYFNLVGSALSELELNGTVTNLDLKDNNLGMIRLSELQKVETLILKNNSIYNIKPFCSEIQPNAKLHFLDLSNNPELGDIPTDCPLNSLIRLDLSKTGLQHFPISLVASNKNLRKLNVAQNKLKEINPQHFKYLQNLDNFEIHDNDWNCYNLNSLASFLRDHSITYSGDTYDENFPGEYIERIACMYRIEEDGNDVESINEPKSSEEISPNYEQLLKEELSGSKSEQMTTSPTVEDDLNVEFLSKKLDTFDERLKIIVNFYDAKFDKVYERLEKLEKTLKEFEKGNQTFWEGVAITL